MGSFCVPVYFILLSPVFNLRVTSVGDCTAGGDSEHLERSPVFLAREEKDFLQLESLVVTPSFSLLVLAQGWPQYSRGAAMCP